MIFWYLNPLSNSVSIAAIKTKRKKLLEKQLMKILSNDIFQSLELQASSIIFFSSVSFLSTTVLYFLIEGALYGLVNLLSLNFILNSEVDGLRLMLLWGLLFVLLKGLIIFETEWARDLADWTRLAFTEMLWRTLSKLFDFSRMLLVL